jgi:hypothetical protein
MGVLQIALGDQRRRRAFTDQSSQQESRHISAFEPVICHGVT